MSDAAEMAAPSFVHEGRTGRIVTRIGPFVLGIGLYGLNNLGVLSGWLAPPPGFAPMLTTRQLDMAQYLTWLEAYRRGGVLLPDYHAPWRTEPALFNPLMWLLAKISNLFGLEVLTAYRVAHVLMYVGTAYALLFAVRVFTATRKESWLAAALIVGAIPVSSFKILAEPLLERRWDPILWLTAATPWRGLIAGNSVDGFSHANPGSMLATFGTGMTLLAFALLASYVKSGRRRYLALVAAVLFLDALIHPFEIVVIAGGGLIGLRLWDRQPWGRAFAEVSAILGATVLGLLPHVYLVIRHQWLRQVSNGNHWYPGNPINVLLMLGLPAMMAAALLVIQPRMRAKTDLILQSWFVCTLVGIYIPQVPWSQHLFDGFHYGTALLLARQLSENRLFGRVRQGFPSLVPSLVACFCFVSLIPHATARWQSFRDGNRPIPSYLTTTVAPADEAPTIVWLRHHAAPDDLILAPGQLAPWVTTVPMHSFGSHWLFSITGDEQIRLADAFFDGQLTMEDAARLLSGYGVRYVLVPRDNQAIRYLARFHQSAAIGALTVYELETNSMTDLPHPKG